MHHWMWPKIVGNSWSVANFLQSEKLEGFLFINVNFENTMYISIDFDVFRCEPVLKFKKGNISLAKILAE